MQGFLKFVVIIFLGWLFIRWVERNVLGYPILPGEASGTVGGWPYAAPLNNSGSVVKPARAPPRGDDWASYFGFNYGGNQGPDQRRAHIFPTANCISAGSGYSF